MSVTKRNPGFGDVPYEPYVGVTCPVCGYPLTEDLGPYPEHYQEDPSLHYMGCPECMKNFDAGPAGGDPGA